MGKQLFVCGVVAAAAGLFLTACGGSGTSSSSSSGSTSVPSTATSAPAANNGGSSFCTQVGTDAAQLSHLGSGLAASPGAVPDISTYKELIGTVAQAIDNLDGSAPGEIASALHTLRTAYDQANSQAQSANTLQELSAAFIGLGSTSVKAAATSVTNYFKTTCGVNPSP